MSYIDAFNAAAQQQIDFANAKNAKAYNDLLVGFKWACKEGSVGPWSAEGGGPNFERLPMPAAKHVGVRDDEGMLVEVITNEPVVEPALKWVRDAQGVVTGISW